MASVRVAERYSRSLLDLAIETSKVDQVFDDMTLFKGSLASRDLANLLLNPTVRGEKKNAILQKIFADAWSPLTLKFVEVVTRKGREDVLPDMVDTFFQQYNEYKGITQVVVTSAKPLDAKTLDRIKEKVKASGTTKPNIEIQTKVDPNLIGGFILEYNNKQYDASVRGKLNKLKQKLVN
ncbi:ATP synthase F1 subunit delta [Membranicola marinus]|uniref:ATP synthase subunit delta n=1 Tax=Membranihabitans marinus TaxID=1227546 RepID=A0A953HYV1_9BACT|nr:ATP synthase F1 subunit delta [Membranihabitans marinus]MBY5958232.1 ATP synthase F1 subunit delta [Membranihabitans marinus]